MKFSPLCVLLTVLLSSIGGSWAAADITDFNTWSLIEDPPNENFSGSVDSSGQITLMASGGPVNSGVDIGYGSINGMDPTTSTAGYYFGIESDFSVAVDFDMSFSAANGTLAFGFGIGEAVGGENSAGATLVANDGVPQLFGAAARTSDVDAFLPIAISASSSARLIVSYTAASGDIVAGVSIDGDDDMDASRTFSGKQNEWNDGPLMASFFIRSDDILGTPWNSGESTTTVTNFHVISGTPLSAVPEPGSIVALIGLGLTCCLRRRRGKNV